MIKRFTMYRRGDLSATHNEQQVAPPNEPQFEGVVFSDGTTVLRWCTPLKSTSVWADLETALGVHGHPEERYQSELVWHKDEAEVSEPIFHDTSYAIPLGLRLKAATTEFSHPRLGIKGTGQHIMPITTNEARMLLRMWEGRDRYNGWT